LRIDLCRKIIDEHQQTVHGSVAPGEEGVDEVYTYLFHEYLPLRFPTVFKLSEDKMALKNLATGKAFPTSTPRDRSAALRIIDETVEEYMFLLKKTPDGYKCVAFVCCFSSGWDPSAKLDRSLKDIHVTVPAFEKILFSMERFFTNLEPGKSVKRVNVSFLNCICDFLSLC
jgi:hypothetical protein